MLPELCAFIVFFCAESVSVVTSGHVTKMAGKPFDPRWPKNPCYTQTSRLYLLYNWSYCRLKFYIVRIGNITYFLRKILENVKFSICTAKLLEMISKHIFWPITDCSSWYATVVTRIQSVVLRLIGERGHFRSRDMDGGHTIRSAIAEKPLLYANFTALSFMQPELLPIEVLHCGIREFRVFFFAKNSAKYYFFCSHPKKDVAVAETRL